MINQPIKIKFVNETHPHSTFDLLRIEELFQRESLDHSPEQLHKVEFFIVIFITEGQGYHTVDFTDYKIKKGSVLTIRQGQLHKFNKNKSLKGYLVLFKDDFLISYLEKVETQKTFQLFNELIGEPKMQLGIKEFKFVQDIVGRMESEYEKIMDEYSLSIIRSELHILVTKLFRIKALTNQTITGRKYLSEFTEFQRLVELYVEDKNRVSEYATMMSVSTKTLNTISKAIIHKTAKQFIDEIRIKRIKRLLINSTKNISEVAYASNFEETTNFYKYFKRHVHMTPEQFRAAF